MPSHPRFGFGIQGRVASRPSGFWAILRPVIAVKVYRTIHLPPRLNPSWDERWRGEDGGLVASWEAGRRLADARDPRAALARLDQLPTLPWKGGFPAPDPNRPTPKSQGQKYGTFFYLAMWQGLRGEDLSIDTSNEVTVVCSLHQRSVIFTTDWPAGTEEEESKLPQALLPERMPDVD